MEKKQITKINLNGLKNVLSPKEMKNVTGGSGEICSSPYPCWVRCGNGAAGCINDCESACSDRGGVEYCWC